MDELRAVRRRRRLGNVAWGDLAYRVYTTALGSIVLVIFASGLVGDAALDRTATARVAQWGPRWAGLLAGVMLLLGARSGARGGPLALEAADVHNLLLAPVPRGRVLRRPSIGTLGYGALGAAAAGALAGLLFAQRMPGGNAAFISSGVVYGATAAAGAFGTAFLAASRRLDARLLITLALAACAASVAQLAGVLSWAPLTLLGEILFWPLHFNPGSLLAILLCAAAAAAGIATIGGLSLEAAQRRTRLVGQLRFAVTQQDLRSVLLLRRQLANEQPTRRNHLRRPARVLGRHFPVLGRDLASFGRWPPVRVLRVLLLGLAAGLVARGIWSGTTPLVLVGGLCTYVAALDAVEPLAQEIDHPLLVDSYPELRGIVFQRHLLAPVLLMVGALTPGALLALLLAPSAVATLVALLTMLTAALAAVAGAAVSVVGEAILSALDEAMMPPEVAGPRVVLRTIWPPLVAVSGFAPVLGAQRAARAGTPVVNGALWAAVIPLALSAAVFVWVRYRDDLHDTLNEAMGR